VLLCYGTPSSRLVEPLHATLADELGFRLIVADRPGFGRSDPQPGRTLHDWPADAAHLLDVLDAPVASVVGSSGGGPYALACAALLGPRVLAVALHAPAPPREAPERGFVPIDPDALRRRGTALAELLTTNPDGFFDFVAPSLSEPDQKRWSEPDVRTAALTMFREVFRQGVDAYVQDHLINQSSWSDLLPRVTQPVGLWQGDTDHNVPLAATQYLAGLMRHGQLTVLPATGHIISTDHWRALYGQLLTAAAP
jgi:pimeloyl-ACP methyl ester carboxylesterase